MSMVRNDFFHFLCGREGALSSLRNFLGIDKFSNVSLTSRLPENGREYLFKCELPILLLCFTHASLKETKAFVRNDVVFRGDFNGNALQMQYS